MTCGRSSMVELQLPKLIARVRFPSPAPLVGRNGYNAVVVRPRIPASSFPHRSAVPGVQHSLLSWPRPPEVLPGTPSSDRFHPDHTQRLSRLNPGWFQVPACKSKGVSTWWQGVSGDNLVPAGLVHVAPINGSRCSGEASKSGRRAGVTRDQWMHVHAGLVHAYVRWVRAQSSHRPSFFTSAAPGRAQNHRLYG